MYKIYPSLVLGFHACERDVGEKILAGETELKRSQNNYDWLGHGVYFWENSPHRAESWGKLLVKQGRLEEPFVIGAVIGLGRCFDLLESHSLEVLQEHYFDMFKTYQAAEIENRMPCNENIGGSEDLLLRRLDCAVIEYMHDQREQESKYLDDVQPFDTVRSAFWEGGPLYPDAGFKEKNHIQICVRNPNCIKGYFRPINKKNPRYPAV